MRYAAPPYILAFSRFFFHVGQCSRGFLTFSGDVASRGSLDAIETMEMPQSHGLGSTRSSSQARAQRETVDSVSGHRTVKLYSRHYAILGQHVDSPRSNDGNGTAGLARSWSTIVA